MASLKEIKGRINSVNSTLKITSAMKMVASAKLHRAQNAIGKMLPYESRLHGILSDLLAGAEVDSRAGGEAVKAERFTLPREVRNVAIVVFSSNSSLCGGFNSSVIRRASELIESYVIEGVPKENITVYSVGRKAEEAMKKLGFPSPGPKVTERSGKAVSAALGRELTEAYLAGRFDKIDLVYNHFKSVASQPTMVETYLPFPLSAHRHSEGSHPDLSRLSSASDHDAAPTASFGDAASHVSVAGYIFEPDRQTILDALLPKVITLKLHTVLLDSEAAEHAARTVAMQTATDNGNELLRDLTLEYNKGRQQKITNELLDIVGATML